jgi:hypothetical protein
MASRHDHGLGVREWRCRGTGRALSRDRPPLSADAHQAGGPPRIVRTRRKYTTRRVIDQGRDDRRASRRRVDTDTASHHGQRGADERGERADGRERGRNHERHIPAQEHRHRQDGEAPEHRSQQLPHPRLAGEDPGEANRARLRQRKGANHCRSPIGRQRCPLCARIAERKALLQRDSQPVFESRRVFANA